MRSMTFHALGAFPGLILTGLCSKHALAYWRDLGITSELPVNRQEFGVHSWERRAGWAIVGTLKILPDAQFKPASSAQHR